MPIYAIATRGPMEHPDSRTIVEILHQIEAQPHGRWLCKDLITGKELEFYHANLNLFWKENFKP